MSVTAVIVDYHADQLLADCVASLRRNAVTRIVVVENGAPGSARDVLDDDVVVVEPRLNLGYGRGVNRGVAVAAAGDDILVCNPDLVLHDGAVAAMTATLAGDARVGVVGPTIERPDGTVYPAHRVFPNVVLAGLHALLAPVWPSNPATRRYRAPRADGSVDWVSGACFLIRRSVFDRIGGFDERYFMFAEDMDLCWRVGHAGYRVTTAPSAIVTHVEGVSRARAPWAMTRAHHVSALRFEAQTARGVRRLLVPVAAVVLGARLAALAVARVVRPKA
jgi:N-acetylglucosaminyl-diphospho-decaprenol L-rhamnosyltransferase